VSKKYGVRELVWFERRVGGARWMGREGKWEVDIEGVGNGKGEEREKVVVDVLINATGCLNNWKLPEIEGLDSLRGRSCIVRVGTRAGENEIDSYSICSSGRDTDIG
jgi:cation diffusion facilitator CzcD-associated flavoprotein CzcO